MKQPPDSFANLHLEDADLMTFSIVDNTIVINARNVGLLANDSDHVGNSMKWFRQAQLTFLGVSSSERAVTEYAGDPKVDGFRPPDTIVDGLSELIDDVDSMKCELSLGSLSPQAWVDWTIVCKEVVVELSEPL